MTSPLAGGRRLWLTLRNRLLSDPRFHRFAARVAPLRPMARGEARALFDLVAGFVYSQVLAAVVETKLLERLSAGPMTLPQVQAALAAPEDATDRLLRAGLTLGLISDAGDGAYVPGPRGAALLGNPGLKEMIAHHRHFYADMADPLALMRRGGGGGALAAYWPYARAQAPSAVAGDSASRYSALMADSLPAYVADILDVAPLEGRKVLMDVGGGEGVFLIAAGARAPHLQLALFDLPAVAARAEARLAAAGLGARAATHGGDFSRDPLPRGADLISLIRIAHDHDDAVVLQLFKSIRAALPPGGALMVAEPMADARGQDKVADVYFAFYLLAMGHGRVRSPQALTAMLREAGFARVRFRWTSALLPFGVLIAS
jgi:demethylspheroidene O-methyltransferase